jgi:cation transport ATPase
MWSRLKQIADLFGVTVDYLLQEEHPASAETAEQEQVLTKKRQSIRARGFVTGMSILLVWLVATVLFMICDMAGADLIPHWIFFIYAIPASMILWLVLNSIWFNRRRNYLIISLLMWSVLISVFVTIWQIASYNAGLIFMLGIPGQAIVVMWSRLKQNGDK